MRILKAPRLASRIQRVQSVDRCALWLRPGIRGRKQRHVGHRNPGRPRDEPADLLEACRLDRERRDGPGFRGSGVRARLDADPYARPHRDGFQDARPGRGRVHAPAPRPAEPRRGPGDRHYGLRGARIPIARTRGGGDGLSEESRRSPRIPDACAQSAEAAQTTASAGHAREQPGTKAAAQRTFARGGVARFQRTAGAGDRYRAGDDQRRRSRRQIPVRERLPDGVGRHRRGGGDRQRRRDVVRRGARRAQPRARPQGIQQRGGTARLRRRDRGPAGNQAGVPDHEIAFARPGRTRSSRSSPARPTLPTASAPRSTCCMSRITTR